jgi:uncharacterized protein (TIGR00730 family)
MRAVTVYCSSGSHVPPAYFTAAAELGRAIAAQRWTLVYGGNSVGCMGALADAAREGGGMVIGVTPQVLVDKGIADEQCHELVITQDMRQRKAIMEERGDAFIALPGGLGTFEEIFEIIVGRVLGTHAKPIVLLNIAGYYDPLLAMIDHGVEQRFIKGTARDLYRVFAAVGPAIDYLCRHEKNPEEIEPQMDTDKHR